eukprot:CAMPEP_0176136902 /NCGR_PEP_ID=MMETSP0120_2-20121206/69489_1 /TAXON_ID=160619 /ORGANISM="Kryptoperidinium foliaceum, Strain CCMP 1326" /LENGTH=118 /DNA_ID=CAMNT_0017472711 /DNA_START=23 /DNA_END=375 /DNA_ORIENTATION=+
MWPLRCPKFAQGGMAVPARGAPSSLLRSGRHHVDARLRRAAARSLDSAGGGAWRGGAPGAPVLQRRVSGAPPRGAAEAAALAAAPAPGGSAAAARRGAAAWGWTLRAMAGGRPLPGRR